MKALFSLLLLSSLAVLIVGSIRKDVPKDVPPSLSVIAFFEVPEAEQDLKNNSCIIGGDYNFVVKLRYFNAVNGDDGLTTLGFWNKKTHILGIDKSKYRSVEIISHEVSHSVDTATIEKDIEKREEGHEIEAYLQGYLTECIMDLAAQNKIIGNRDDFYVEY